jgi:hypothetical protein
MCLPEHLAAGRVVKACRNTSLANGVQQAGRSQRRDVAGIFRNIEAHTHVALRAQVINFVRSDAVKQFGQACGIRQVGEMEEETGLAVAPIRD